MNHTEHSIITQLEAMLDYLKNPIFHDPKYPPAGYVKISDIENQIKSLIRDIKGVVS